MAISPTSSSDPVLVPGLGLEMTKPTDPFVGQIYYDQALGEQRIWNGVEWTPIVLTAYPELKGQEYTEEIIEFLLDRYPQHETFKHLITLVEDDELIATLMSEHLTKRTQKSISVEIQVMPGLPILVRSTEKETDLKWEHLITEEKLDDYFKPTDLILKQINGHDNDLKFDDRMVGDSSQSLYFTGTDIAMSDSSSAVVVVNYSDEVITITPPTNQTIDTLKPTENTWEQLISNTYTQLKASLGFGSSKKESAVPETRLLHS